MYALTASMRGSLHSHRSDYQNYGNNRSRRELTSARLRGSKIYAVFGQRSVFLGRLQAEALSQLSSIVAATSRRRPLPTQRPQQFFATRTSHESAARAPVTRSISRPVGCEA